MTLGTSQHHFSNVRPTLNAAYEPKVCTGGKRKADPRATFPDSFRVVPD